MTGELSQHKVEKNERIESFVNVEFFDKQGEVLEKQKLRVTYVEYDGNVIEQLEVESPSGWVMSQADNFKYDIKEAIESRTGKSIFGELNFIS